MSDITRASLTNSIDSDGYHADIESAHRSVGTMDGNSIAVTSTDSHRVTEEMKQEVERQYPDLPRLVAFSGVSNAVSSNSFVGRMTASPTIPSRLSNIRSNIKETENSLEVQKEMLGEGEPLSSQQVSELASMIGDINRKVRELLAAAPTRRGSRTITEATGGRTRQETTLLNEAQKIQDIISDLKNEAMPHDLSKVLDDLKELLKHIKATVDSLSSHEKAHEEHITVSRDSGDLSSVTDDFGSDHQTRGSNVSNVTMTTPSPHMEVEEVQNEARETEEMKDSNSSSTSYGAVLSDSSWGLGEGSVEIGSNSSTQGTDRSLHHTDTTASMTSDGSNET